MIMTGSQQEFAVATAPPNGSQHSPASTSSVSSASSMGYAGVSSVQCGASGGSYMGWESPGGTTHFTHPTNFHYGPPAPSVADPPVAVSPAAYHPAATTTITAQSPPLMNGDSGAAPHPPAVSSAPANNCGGTPPTGVVDGTGRGGPPPPPPPPHHQQPHTVHFHVQPGEAVSLQLGEQVQTIQGLYTSLHRGEQVQTIQAPPGHYFQQVMDENGVYNLILAPQHPPPYGPPPPTGTYPPPPHNGATPTLPPPPGNGTPVTCGVSAWTTVSPGPPPAYFITGDPGGGGGGGNMGPPPPPPPGGGPPPPYHHHHHHHHHQPNNNNSNNANLSNGGTNNCNNVANSHHQPSPHHHHHHHGPPPPTVMPPGGGNGLPPSHYMTGSTGYEHQRHNKGPKKRFRNGGGMMSNGGLDPQGGGYNKQMGGGNAGGMNSKVSGSSSPSLSVQSTPPQSPVKPRGNGYNNRNRRSGSTAVDDSEESGIGNEPDEDQEENGLYLEILSNIRTPKVSEIRDRLALLVWSPPDAAEPTDPKFEGLKPIEDADLEYEVLVSDKGKEGKYRSIFTGPSMDCYLTDLRPNTEYHIRVHAVMKSRKLKGGASDTVSFHTLACEPDQPPPPKMSQRSKTSINLRWNAPSDNGASISRYLLEYDEGGLGGGGTNNSINLSNSSANANANTNNNNSSGSGSSPSNNSQFVTAFEGRAKSYNLTKLQPSTVYRFRLAAFNDHGRSRWSEIVSYMTQGSPPSQPQPPSAADFTESTMRLLWKKRPCDEEFSLQMEDPKTGHGFLPLYNGPDVEHIVSGLNRNTVYRFKLKAHNENGASSYSGDVSYSTLPGRPGPPARPQLKGKVRHDRFRVTWSPPEDDGGSQITGYLLEIDNGSGWQCIYHGPDLDFTCDQNLVPGGGYRVRVAAESAGGRSDHSETCFVTTEAVPPGPPPPPALVEKPAATSLHLMWSPPAFEGGAKVTEYEIDMTSPDNTTRGVYRGRETRCVVASLLPSRHYLFQVRAYNRAGPGPWSESLEVISGAGPPERPSEPRLSPNKISAAPPTASSVRVSWDQPINNGAIITAYRLEVARLSFPAEDANNEYVDDDDEEDEDETDLDESQAEDGDEDGATEESSRTKADGVEYDDDTTSEEEEEELSSSDYDEAGGKGNHHRRTAAKTTVAAKHRRGGGGGNSKAADNTASSGGEAVVVGENICDNNSGISDRGGGGKRNGGTAKDSSRCHKTAAASGGRNERLEAADEEAAAGDTVVSDDDLEWRLAYQGPDRATDLKDLVPATRYRMRLCAINSAGASPFSASVAFETAPGAPSKPGVLSSSSSSSKSVVVGLLSVVESTATSLTVKWPRSANNGQPILRYFLEWTTTTSGSSSTTANSLETDRRKAVLSDLRPDTTYSLRVAAVNSVGRGPFSDSVKASTRQLPPAPPRLDCISVQHNSLKLKWAPQPPPNSSDSSSGGGKHHHHHHHHHHSFSGGGVGAASGNISTLGTNYILETENLAARRRGVWSIVYQGLAHSHKHSKLQENTEYRYRISAVTEAGQGPPSAVIAFKTSFAPPPPVKVAPRVSSITETGCLVQWSPIKGAQAGEQIQYRLQLTRVRDGETKSLNSGSDTQFRLEGLEPKSEHAVRICALRIPSESGSSPQPLQGSLSPPASFTTLASRGNANQQASHNSQESGKSSSKTGGSGSSASEKVGSLQWSDQHWALIILSGFTLFAFFVAVAIQQLISLGTVSS